MGITKTKFGEINGRDVYAFTLDNGKGLRAEILNYGGIIRRLIYNGVDVVLGRDSIEEYLDNEGYFGALIGRNSNRIEKAEFVLNGESFKLYANDKGNNLHGGKDGFDRKIWATREADGAEPSLCLSLESPDGEEGFPGTVRVEVTYTLTSDNGIRIHYCGESDKDTVLNMTNHAYFNLNGHTSGVVDNHKLWLNCDFYTPNMEDCVPNGEVRCVCGTAFDFRAPKTLGESFKSNEEQIRLFDGIDHNFAINGGGLRKAARFEGDKTGIIMEVITDCPGIQVYTGNVIEEGRVCKDGAVYCVHDAVCLETQTFPNHLKHRHFPGGILKKGEKYDTVTEYKFI